eukprot:527554-Amphidinium_carterae.1
MQKDLAIGQMAGLRPEARACIASILEKQQVTKRKLNKGASCGQDGGEKHCAAMSAVKTFFGNPHSSYTIVFALHQKPPWPEPHVVVEHCNSLVVLTRFLRTQSRRASNVRQESVLIIHVEVTVAKQVVLN